MEELAEANESFRIPDDETRSSVFSQLKPFCLDLLELLQNPKKNSTAISELFEFLSRTPGDSLQPFLDYTLIPLLLILDAAVGCRSSQKVTSEEKMGVLNVPKTPHWVSDSVAEGVLLCLEELLKKCPLRSSQQMVLVLKKLTYGAMLSPSEAAEEFREGMVRCFRALLLSLLPCCVEGCACKKIPGLPALLDRSSLQFTSDISLKYQPEPEECLLAFLQSQTCSAAVGHWLSILLESADAEAARGHRGSAKLRVEVFLTLRLLVAKVGYADALAFFLPGVVSKFTKVLHVGKTMTSGAAGSTEAMDQAVRGLAEFLMIVFEDDANLSALDLSLDDIHGSYPNKESTESFLDALRCLPINAQDEGEILSRDSNHQIVSKMAQKVDYKEKRRTDSVSIIGSLSVNRTKDWIMETSAHVDKLLSATFPNLCVHPAKKVQKALLAAIKGLLTKCIYTMKKSKLMLLECLCALVCDDSEEVSLGAQEFLDYLFVSGEKHLIEWEVAEIFKRLIEKIPIMVLRSEERDVLSHAHRLLAIIYYSGPQIVVDQLLRSPMACTQILDALALCLGQNSVFAGSLDKFMLMKPSSVGYLPSVAELKSGTLLRSANQAITSAPPYGVSSISVDEDKEVCGVEDILRKKYELPRMPPWFIYVNNEKLYEALAGILRLVGLSLMADPRNEVSFSSIIDIPLGHLRILVSEIRMREYSKESWQTWYLRTGSGQLLRQASTAACILNEMIFGVSDESVDIHVSLFQKFRTGRELIQGYDAQDADDQHCNPENSSINECRWKVQCGRDSRNHLIECVGTILHEYLSPEVWDLPKERKSSVKERDGEEDITLHFFRDTAMLHQVIIDGIGIANLCLGKDFTTSGFLHSSLYLLLENLTCSNYQIRSAADAVLHILSASSGHPTVGCFVVANADYIIDSLCRQLRHLDLNPHVPSVLASMLSYIGVAHQILPLLEEPMRSVSQELEILGRNKHPYLTVSFLKAVAEIAKASKYEAYSMQTQAESYSIHIKAEMSNLEKKARKDSRHDSLSDSNDDIAMVSEGSEETYAKWNDNNMPPEQWEKFLFKLDESQRYRRLVGSISDSCLTAATPLLASQKEAACLVALDIVEDGISTLAKVEEAYRHKKKEIEAVRQVIDLCSFPDLQDALDAAEEGTDENRLLPAMNKIWPYLVVCVQLKNPVAVRRCLGVVSSVVQICGGDFFSRRFHNDGSHFWKLLKTSPFQKKPISGHERTPLQLPYRSSYVPTEDSMAEASSLKVQAAALNMIADLSRNKRSASAMEVVLKKVCGLVVGIACSGVTGLRDASINALSGLASIDPDLIWLLLADVYYSLKKKDLPSPPSSDLCKISQLLPPPLSSKDFLYLQYGGETFGFDIDFSSVETVFQKLHSECGLASTSPV